MLQIVGVTELQRRFRTIFDEVVRGKTAFVLTRGSRPEAALIPYDEFQRYQAFVENQILTRFDDLVKHMETRNQGVSAEEVLDDVQAARNEA